MREPLKLSKQLCHALFEWRFFSMVGNLGISSRELTVEYMRAGRQEFIPIVVNDENGELRVIGKQHVFKDSLDYIDQLKGERNTDK